MTQHVYMQAYAFRPKPVGRKLNRLLTTQHTCSSLPTTMGEELIRLHKVYDRIMCRPIDTFNEPKHCRVLRQGSNTIDNTLSITAKPEIVHDLQKLYNKVTDRA